MSHFVDVMLKFCVKIQTTQDHMDKKKKSEKVEEQELKLKASQNQKIPTCVGRLLPPSHCRNINAACPDLCNQFKRMKVMENVKQQKKKNNQPTCGKHDALVIEVIAYLYKHFLQKLS